MAGEGGIFIIFAFAVKRRRKLKGERSFSRALGSDYEKRVRKSARVDGSAESLFCRAVAVKH
jgi:hypothetical protein